MAMIYGVKAGGLWSNDRQANLLDGGAPFYATYACADGKFVAVGPIEPPFYRLFLEKAGITDPDLAGQHDLTAWPAQRAKLAAIFATRPRDEWCSLLEGSDACVSPVLDLDEAPQHPHNQARQTFVVVDDVLQPAPAPRLSRTPGAIRNGPPVDGQDTCAVLHEYGFAQAEIDALLAAGCIGTT
jgi:alpha-methylacyl-CoA racemase